MVSRQRLHQLAHPEKNAARKAVAKAIERGKLEPASVYICVLCDNPAVEYDHYEGYDRDNWLTVRPVCRACHHTDHPKHPDPIRPEGLTVDEVAARLSVTPSGARKYIQKGQLPAKRWGRKSYLVQEADVEQFLKYARGRHKTA